MSILLTIGLVLLVLFILFVALGAYACCVAAGQADRLWTNDTHSD